MGQLWEQVVKEGAPPDFLILYHSSVCGGLLPLGFEEKLCSPEGTAGGAAIREDNRPAEVTNVQAWVWLHNRKLKAQDTQREETAPD